MVPRMVVVFPSCQLPTPRSGTDGKVCHHVTAGKPARETGGAYEQQFVRQVIELHDKYLQVCTECCFL